MCVRFSYLPHRHDEAGNRLFRQQAAGGSRLRNRRARKPGLLRKKQVEKSLLPAAERLGQTIWAFVAKRPALYRLATKIGVRFMRMMAGNSKTISKLPLAGGWMDYREMPAPNG